DLARANQRLEAEVAERRRVEAEARKQASLLDLTHDSVFVRDLNDVITYWNRGAEQRYGWSRAEAIGRVSHQLMETVFPAPLQEIESALYRTGQWEGELVHTTRDGTRVVVASRWSLQRDEQGRPCGVLETNNDVTGRKRAEETLRRSEAYLGESQKLTHTGSWALNLASREMVHASEELLRLFGFDPGLGIPPLERFFERIHPDDRTTAVEVLERSAREKTGAEWIFRAVLPDGTVRSIYSVTHPVLSGSGELVEIVGTDMDVTERKRAEEELRESERRYRHIFQSVGVSIWHGDFADLKAAIDDLKAQGVRDFRQYLAAHPEFARKAFWMVKIVDVNDRSLELLGAASKDELLGSLSKVFVPETRKVLAGVLMAIAEGRSSFAAESEIRTLKGEKLTVLITTTFPPPPTRLDSVLVTLTDITEQKRAEYLTAQVFEASPDAMCIVGRDYRCQRINAVAAQIFATSAERAVGMHMADLAVPGAFERRLKPALDRCFKGEVVSYADWIGTKGFGQRYIAVSYSPLRPTSDRAEAALAVARDLTDHMQAWEALREAQAELARVTRVTMLGEITASIAHEVNQPLAGVVLNGNACRRWLAADPPNLDEARQAAHRVVKDGERAGQIIARIRALVKRGTTERSALAVNEVISEALGFARAELERQRVEIRTELDGDLPAVLGDRVQLQQVLVNLILNARDAMADLPGGTAELTVASRRESSGEVLVEVRDRGRGIDRAQADRIFEAFFSTKPTGLGMGLSVSRSIVELHGGRIWATPNDGPGATMRFTLPAAPQGDAAPAEERSAPNEDRSAPAENR
ncbi:MAG TPA: PAS domain S-box protein, partial [Myxococcales bacterium]|nr:PAS domain S-box protein [Myxococcales bacterium]